MGSTHRTTHSQDGTDQRVIQRRIFEHVMTLLEHQQGFRLFIDGKAGCGETTLVNAICDLLRSQQKIVLATATSAFAAQLYPGGKTVHSTFKVCI